MKVVATLFALLVAFPAVAQLGRSELTIVADARTRSVAKPADDVFDVAPPWQIAVTDKSGTYIFTASAAGKIERTPFTRNFGPALPEPNRQFDVRYAPLRVVVRGNEGTVAFRLFEDTLEAEPINPFTLVPVADLFAPGPVPGLLQNCPRGPFPNSDTVRTVTVIRHLARWITIQPTVRVISEVVGDEFEIGSENGYPFVLVDFYFDAAGGSWSRADQAFRDATGRVVVDAHPKRICYLSAE